MSEPTGLRQALLDLGLEDLIPLPEMATSEEVRSVFQGEAAVGQLRTALIGLLKEGRIQIWSGHWSREPEVVDPAAAEGLLRVDEQYVCNSPADLRLRVYYANIDNIRV